MKGIIMYIVEFSKDEDLEEESYHRVFVYDFTELLQLLNYIDKFEYILFSVHKEDMFIGYETFRAFIKDYVEDRKEPKEE